MSKERMIERIRHRKRNAVDPEEFLLEAGAIEPTEREEELQLTPAFFSAIEENVEHYAEEGVGTEILAEIFGVEEDEVTEVEREYTAYKILYTIRKWPSEDSFVLDAAIHTALRNTTDDWDAVPPRQRYRILQSLRAFPDTCFFCGGTVTHSGALVQSCCSERHVTTISCEGCERRFIEFTAETSEEPEIQNRTNR